MSNTEYAQILDWIDAGSAIRDLGISLTSGRDFSEFDRILATQNRRHPTLSQFKAQLNDDLCTDAIWICGYAPDGMLVHTQALQLLELGCISVADFLKKHVRQMVPASPPIDLSTCKVNPGPMSSRLSGKAVYQGEMWLDHGLRTAHIAPILIRHAMHMAVSEWNPDSIFGLIAWGLACSGFATRIGYFHGEPLTLTWERSDNKKQHQVWSVFMEREDLTHLFKLPVVDLSDQILKKFYA